MDNKVESNNDIRYAIDAQFSGVTKKPELQKRILQQVRGEIVVKKKLSVGLVMLIVLVLTTVTALALVTWKAVVENVMAIESENGRGSFGTWSLDEKLRLIESIRSSGIGLPQDKVDSLQDKSLTESEKEQIATAILTERYGREDMIGHKSIMEKEKGSFDTWSIEDKAWYTEQLSKHGLLGYDQEKYLLPGSGDIQEEEAVSLAKKTMLEKFVLLEGSLDTFPVEASFMQNNQFGEDPVWLIQFTAVDGLYTVVFTGQGKLMYLSSPGGEVSLGVSSIDDILTKSTLVQPRSSDASKDQILLNSIGLLTEVISLSKEEAAEYTADAYFMYNDQFGNKNEPVWFVVLSRDGVPTYKELYGYDGSFIDWAPVDKEFLYEMRFVAQEDELGSLADQYDSQGQIFYDWPLEDKAAFSKKWIPIAEKYKEEHPYFTGEGSAIWEWTRRVYGLPGPLDISQDEALRVAQDAMKQLGATDQMVKRLSRHAFFFDITQADEPQWRVMITRPASGEPFQKGDEKQYYVKIDARTGALIEVHDNSYYNIPSTFIMEP